MVFYVAIWALFWSVVGLVFSLSCLVGWWLKVGVLVSAGIAWVAMLVLFVGLMHDLRRR